MPALSALAPGNPPSGPVFAVVQGLVLVFFVVMIIGAITAVSPFLPVPAFASIRRRTRVTKRGNSCHAHDYDQRRRRRSIYKDWGKGQPIVFSHGWPLSADDWDAQMLFFLNNGYRVIAHDRRGHGRSTQTGDGHDMDHYADDLAALTDASRPEERHPRRPFHRRRRGGALHGPAWREPGGEGGHHQRGAAADGEDARPIPVGCPRRCSTTCRRSSPPTARNSIATCRQGPFYGYNRPGAKAVRGRSSRTGGARA